MPDNAKRFDPTKPLPPEVAAFAHRVNTLLEENPRNEAAVAEALATHASAFDLVASHMYNVASMLVGEGEDSMRLVETAVIKAEKATCADPDASRRSGRRILVGEALQILTNRDATSLAAPQGFEPAQSCIEDDDLSSAGVSRDQLEEMLSGSDRGRVRTWLESLPTATRTIFVLRAVIGYNTPETADLLSEFGGPEAAGWTPDAVRELFRQGLCSLASQLIHSQQNP